MAKRTNPIYAGDPLAWESLSLAEKIECIRLDECTGPCGQSMTTMNRRARINHALREVLAMLTTTPPPQEPTRAT